MIELSKVQEIAYKRFITARNKVRVGHYGSGKEGAWVPPTEVICTQEVDGTGRPIFKPNEEWIEYMEAFQEWLRVEPEFRKAERMSMIRGNYGKTDNWRDKKQKIKEM
jgi:hypothetical protein